jgi:dipeptidyl aminopeptidase/acylaminoacyl peptidase
VRRTAIALAALTIASTLLALAARSRAGEAAARAPVPWATLAVSRSAVVGGGIYVIGDGRTRLIAPGAVEASWSPDGRRLAYVSAGAGDAADVFVSDADGTHAGRITRTSGVDEASPRWSPDGMRLVFERAGRIVVAKADGSRERVLAVGLLPAWSPRGQRMAFERDGDLFLVRSSGGKPRRLMTTAGTQTAPAWSPDGRRLAYVSDETGVSDIRVLDVRTGAGTVVTADEADDAAPSFSANGRAVLFVSNRSGTDALWRAPLAGGPATPVGGPPFAGRVDPRPVPRLAELLPDLDQQPPTELDVRPAKRGFRLWFTSAADNVGLGPFIVNGRRRSAGRPMRANQRVRLANGDLRTYPEVGIWRYNSSPDHAHWHLLDFQRYELRRLDGTLVVRDRKSGFCIGDRYGVAPGRIAGRISRPVFRGFCNSYQPAAGQVDGGTSVGYSDRYHSRLDGQNLDLTRVPAGEYLLVNRANPQLLIHEVRYENNAASLRVRITWPRGRSRPPGVRVLATCPDSDRC